MTATLTIINAEPPLTFQLVCDRTIVGRVSVVGRVSREPGLSRITGEINRCEYFVICKEGTLYLGFPRELRLARQHFEILREQDESGERYYARDLKSHCGFLVNGIPNAGCDPMSLKDGDLIECGFVFEIRIRDKAESSPQ